ncbi:MAG: DUF6314 family protein [Sphingomicrobium sp.]
MYLLWSVPNLKAFLLGSWNVQRIVIDRAHAMTGGLKGEATFTPCADGLLYEEHGTLTLGEHRGRAEQSYLYEFPETEGRASVRFRDGRAFHELDLSHGQHRVCHDCHPDLYDGVFIALSSTAWQSEWNVTGPRKQYGLLTTYKR